MTERAQIITIIEEAAQHTDFPDGIAKTVYTPNPGGWSGKNEQRVDITEDYPTGSEVHRTIYVNNGRKVG